MDNIFCTLFDSNYIDRGLVLYHSMVKTMPNFKLYVFAFDDLCYKILKKENLDNLIVIPLDDFENNELLRVKKERTRAEYCWTCSPWVIKYVLEYFNEEICTYIDADMMFFSSPEYIFNDMRDKNCSVIIVPHRFGSIEAEKRAYDNVGIYCVEFNTFLNNENGKKVLNWWADRCLEWCFYAIPGTTKWYGDQKYLNAFPELFDGVYICNHYGVGLAPWNTKLVEKGNYESGNTPVVKVKQTGDEYPVIIHHFEGLSFLTDNIIHIPSGISDRKLHEDIYDIYISNLIEARKYIEEKYNYKLTRARRIVTTNPVMRIYQKYFSIFRRIKRFSDIYFVN